MLWELELLRLVDSSPIDGRRFCLMQRPCSSVYSDFDTLSVICFCCRPDPNPLWAVSYIMGSSTLSEWCVCSSVPMSYPVISWTAVSQYPFCLFPHAPNRNMPIICVLLGILVPRRQHMYCPSVHKLWMRIVDFQWVVNRIWRYHIVVSPNVFFLQTFVH